MNDDQRLAANEPGRRDTTRTYRSGGLAVLVAAAAIGLAACRGGSNSPQVASLPTSSRGNVSGNSTSSSGNGSGRSTAAPSNENPTQLLNEWATCMRRHGDPGQADPTIDASKVIHVTMSPSVPGGVNGSNGQSSSGPGMYCGAYLTAASTALRGGQPPPKTPDQAALVKYAECMRANGVPDFPDPTAGGLELPGGPGSDQNNPTLQNAAKVCVKKTGVQPLGGGGPPPPGSIEDNGGLLVPVSGGNGGPGANG